MPQLVATTDGFSYSILLRKEKVWKVFKAKKVEPYVPFKGYTPLHMKNLRRGCKLFLENHWPGFSRDNFSPVSQKTQKSYNAIKK